MGGWEGGIWGGVGDQHVHIRTVVGVFEGCGGGGGNQVVVLNVLQLGLCLAGRQLDPQQLGELVCVL